MIFERKTMNVNNEKSPHILNAASNLLGICFIVLTSLKLLNRTSKTIIDEVTLGAIILFMCSCIFSFLSLRSKTAVAEKMERVADSMFIAGLVLLVVTPILFSFNLIA